MCVLNLIEIGSETVLKLATFSSASQSAFADCKPPWQPGAKCVRKWQLHKLTVDQLTCTRLQYFVTGDYWTRRLNWYAGNRKNQLQLSVCIIMSVAKVIAQEGDSWTSSLVQRLQMWVDSKRQQYKTAVHDNNGCSCKSEQCRSKKLYVLLRQILESSPICSEQFRAHPLTENPWINENSKSLRNWKQNLIN